MINFEATDVLKAEHPWAPIKPDDVNKRSYGALAVLRTLNKKDAHSQAWANAIRRLVGECQLNTLTRLTFRVDIPGLQSDVFLQGLDVGPMLDNCLDSRTDNPVTRGAPDVIVALLKAGATYDKNLRTKTNNLHPLNLAITAGMGDVDHDSKCVCVQYKYNIIIIPIILIIAGKHDLNYSTDHKAVF